MMRRPHPDLEKLLELRARGALANNPRISPRRLAEETGMTMPSACAWLERNRAAA